MTKATIVTLAFLFPWLLSAPIHAAPSFDCAKATQTSEKLICQSEELSTLDGKLVEAFAAAKKDLGTQAAHDLVVSERQWLRQNSEDCHLSDDHSGGTDTRAHYQEIKCLTDRYKSRISALSQWNPNSESNSAAKDASDDTDPDLVQIDSSPDAVNLCRSILSKNNMAWHGTNIYGDDLFEINIPRSIGQPDWKRTTELDPVQTDDGSMVTVEKSHSGLTKNQTDGNVYKINVNTKQFGCCGFNFDYYMQLDEKNLKFLKSALRNDIEDTSQQYPIVRYTADYKGIIFSIPAEGINTGFFTYKLPGRQVIVYAIISSYVGGDGISTAPEMFTSQGTAYFLDRRGMAIFRPTLKGAFDKTCYRKPLHSHVEATTKIIDARFPCPNQQKPSKDPFKDHDLAMVTLPEWGGTRPVLRESVRISRISTYNSIKIGPVGAEAVTENTAWAPLQKLDTEKWSRLPADLFLTDIGPYIATDEGDSDDTTTTYHRIASNDLIPACSVEKERVPPTGVRDATDDPSDK